MKILVQVQNLDIADVEPKVGRGRNVGDAKDSDMIDRGDVEAGTAARSSPSH